MIAALAVGRVDSVGDLYGGPEQPIEIIGIPAVDAPQHKSFAFKCWVWTIMGAKITLKVVENPHLGEKWGGYKPEL